jgi:hypothetical protein
MDFISNLTNKDYIFKDNSLQKELKANIDQIIEYINKHIIPNSKIDYSEHVESDEDVQEFNKVKEMVINEGIEIVKKLSPILMKHRQMKPNEFVNLDTTTSWFLNESTFIENKEIKSPFYDYKIISKVLTIIFKLVDFINEDYLNEIKYIEQRNMYLEKLLKEKKEELSEFEYIFFSTSVNAKLNSLKIEKEKLMEKFRFFHEVSYTIREYFFALFRIQDSAILTYLPICSLNIFRSSIFFLKEDYQFLEFILKFEEWIPSSYRCIYLLEIIKLFQNKDLDFQIKKSRSKFNPDINLLMLDLMSLYSTLGKNPSVISDLTTINYILANSFKRKRFILQIPIEKLISFVSIQLTIISKLNSEKENIPEKDFEQLLSEALTCIQHVITYDVEIINSYLIHQIIAVLLSFYDEKYDIKSNLDIIFSQILTNKHTIIYLCSMLEESALKNIKLPLIHENKEKLITWTKIYKKLNSIDELIDPITSCVIVIPCVIPMDMSGTMLQVCDKNMLMSYLWDKAENPFTRSSLTIDELEEFNKKEESLEKLKEFKSILKKEISDAKN